MEQTFRVPDMMCAACAAKIQEALARVEGVDEVVASPPEKVVRVCGSAPASALVAAIRAAGFQPDV